MKNKIILKIAFISFGLFFTTTVFANTTINLQIKTDTNTIYDSEITVAPCDSDNDINTLDDITAYCALFQLENSGILPTKSNWSGLWINSINGIANTDTIFWMWLVNLNINTNPDFECHQETPAGCSAKQYILNPNDNVLFYYNTNPLSISVDNENPKVGENIKITVKELGSWGSAWNNAALGKVIINSNLYDLDADGIYSYEIKNNDVLSIKAEKDNFIDSKELTINPEKIVEEVLPPQHGSSGSYISNFVKPIVVEKTFSIENAFKFLETNQKNDGSYTDPLYTDWVAVATGAGDNQNIKEKLIKYYKENNLESNLVTDNERHAMALMSLGINPYSGTSINYIKKITDNFDGAQFGDSSLLNDDIFALVVLKNAGYNGGDEIIIKDINYIISK